MAIDIFVGAGNTNVSKYTFTADKVVMFQDFAGQNTFYAKGTWGGGTLTFYASADGQDTNKFALGITMTADGFVSLPAALGPIKSNGILAIMTGSTTPSLVLWGI